MTIPEAEPEDGPAAAKSLEQRMTELTIGVVGMRGAMEALARAIQVDIEEVKGQLERERRLTKYARRTWFEVMTWITLTALLVNDLARRYCTPVLGSPTQRATGAQAEYPEVCNTVFWTTNHGGSGWWRLLGFLITAGFLFWLGRRSQVPEDLLPETPIGQVRRERDARRLRRQRKRA